MLEKIKLALRIKNNAFDEEILDLIEAAKQDLSVSGVMIINEYDSLIRRAIILYCKANFGLNNEDSEKYQASYNSLKASMGLCGDYNVV